MDDFINAPGLDEQLQNLEDIKQETDKLEADKADNEQLLEKVQKDLASVDNLINPVNNNQDNTQSDNNNLTDNQNLNNEITSTTKATQTGNVPLKGGVSVDTYQPFADFVEQNKGTWDTLTETDKQFSLNEYAKTLAQSPSWKLLPVEQQQQYIDDAVNNYILKSDNAPDVLNELGNGITQFFTGVGEVGSVATRPFEAILESYTGKYNAVTNPMGGAANYYQTRELKFAQTVGDIARGRQNTSLSGVDKFISGVGQVATTLGVAVGAIEALVGAGLSLPAAGAITQGGLSGVRNAEEVAFDGKNVGSAVASTFIDTATGAIMPQTGNAFKNAAISGSASFAGSLGQNVGENNFDWSKGVTKQGIFDALVQAGVAAAFETKIPTKLGKLNTIGAAEATIKNSQIAADELDNIATQLFELHNIKGESKYIERVYKSASDPISLQKATINLNKYAKDTIMLDELDLEYHKDVQTMADNIAAAKISEYNQKIEQLVGTPSHSNLTIVKSLLENSKKLTAEIHPSYQQQSVHELIKTNYYVKLIEDNIKNAETVSLNAEKIKATDSIKTKNKKELQVQKLEATVQINQEKLNSQKEIAALKAEIDRLKLENVKEINNKKLNTQKELTNKKIKSTEKTVDKKLKSSAKIKDKELSVREKQLKSKEELNKNNLKAKEDITKANLTAKENTSKANIEARKKLVEANNKTKEIIAEKNNKTKLDVADKKLVAKQSVTKSQLSNKKTVNSNTGKKAKVMESVLEKPITKTIANDKKRTALEAEIKALETKYIDAPKGTKGPIGEQIKIKKKELSLYKKDTKESAVKKLSEGVKLDGAEVRSLFESRTIPLKAGLEAQKEYKALAKEHGKNKNAETAIKALNQNKLVDFTDYVETTTKSSSGKLVFKQAEEDKIISPIRVYAVAGEYKLAGINGNGEFRIYNIAQAAKVEVREGSKTLPKDFNPMASLSDAIDKGITPDKVAGFLKGKTFQEKNFVRNALQDTKKLIDNYKTLYNYDTKAVKTPTYDEFESWINKNYKKQFEYIQQKGCY